MFLPCDSWRSFSIVVFASSNGGSAATGILEKDCHAVRNDPKTLFFKSMLIRVKLSFSSMRQTETEFIIKQKTTPQYCSTKTRGTDSLTQVHSLAAFMVRDQHGLQIHLCHNHGLYPIGYRVKLHSHKGEQIMSLLIIDPL